MKKIFTLPNIQTALFLLLVVAETVVMILWKPLPVGTILLVQFFAVLCIVWIRFAYRIAYLTNRWHSLWGRKNTVQEDDEPSDLAVGITKTAGYCILLLLQIILFL